MCDKPKKCLQTCFLKITSLCWPNQPCYFALTQEVYQVNELEAFAILASLPHIGATKIRLLLQHCGSACAALQLTEAQLRLLPGFERAIPHWNQWRTNSAWQRDLELAARLGAQLIPFTSPHFPKALLENADHPALLYVRGELKPQDQRSIAVVGTRQASIYGAEMAEAISSTLASHGFTVVSGLARGIDTAAHRGALRTGRTLAVIGSGLARIYPQENQSLAHEIAQQGALISEFPMETPPDRQNFPQRNRIVSGLTLGTLLIEAPVKSGAMITMEKSHLYKRKLFALPGRVDNENFRGNHLLIKSGKAYLVENAEDIIAHYSDLFSMAAVPKASPQRVPLDKEEHTLWERMPSHEINIDELAILTAQPIQQVQRILMSLILKKIVKEFPGKIYKKN